MPCDQNDFTSSPAIRFRMQECFQSQRRFHKTRRRAKPGHVGLYASRRERIAPKKNARDRESQSGSPTRNQKKRSLRTRSNRARNCSRVISTAARGKSRRWNSSGPGFARPNRCTSRTNRFASLFHAQHTTSQVAFVGPQMNERMSPFAVYLALEGGKFGEPFAVSRTSGLPDETNSFNARSSVAQSSAGHIKTLWLFQYQAGWAY